MLRHEYEERRAGASPYLDVHLVKPPPILKTKETLTGITPAEGRLPYVVICHVRSAVKTKEIEEGRLGND